jgi:hypothetical protein
MQTFITDWPVNSWGVQNLDQKRLVKQLLECRQIMAALAGETKGWVNHPATKMWRGKEHLLLNYAETVRGEMSRRGYKWKNNWDQVEKSYASIVKENGYKFPDWFGDAEFANILYTHRGRLYEKDPEHYAQWADYTNYKKYVCCDRCNYYWPTHLEAS